MELPDMRASAVVVGGLTFSAQFECGNLHAVTTRDTPAGLVYVLHILPDAYSMRSAPPLIMRTWFFFSIRGCIPGALLLFEIPHYTNQEALFASDHRPVTRSLPSRPSWTRLSAPALLHVDEGGTSHTLSFRHTVAPVTTPDELLFIAFTYPYSLRDARASIADVCRRLTPHAIDATSAAHTAATTTGVSRDVYVAHEVLTFSREGHPVDMLTVTSTRGQGTRMSRIEGLFPPVALSASEGACPACGAHCCGETLLPRSHAFPEKRVVVITARVHPGETPASFAVDGLLAFLCSDDVRAVALREAFVCVIIPMLNPDGVVRGNFRFDASGVNLNRVYAAPSREAHPTIWAVKTLLESYAGQLFLTLDCHAHAGKRGCFLLGNVLEDAVQQVETYLYPRLVALHTPHMDVSACAFGDMDGETPGASKSGSARVALHRACGHTHAYTLECHYNSGRSMNVIPPASKDGGRASPPTRGRPPSLPPRYTPEIWMGVGKACLLGLLELVGANPWSRLPASPLRTPAYARKFVASEVAVAAVARLTKATSARGIALLSAVSNATGAPPPVRAPPARAMRAHMTIPSVAVGTAAASSLGLLPVSTPDALPPRPESRGAVRVSSLTPLPSAHIARSSNLSRHQLASSARGERAFEQLSAAASAAARARSTGRPPLTFR